MWHYEPGVETTATPEKIWRYWSDTAAWPQWNDGIEKIEIDGPFAVGTMFTMTPPGRTPLRCDWWRSRRATVHRRDGRR